MCNETGQNDFVGWATMADGSRVKLSADECKALWDAADDAKKKRAELMPTERDAIEAMFQAFQRLRELGWKEAMYCPKDGSHFDVIEAGSTGIHDCAYWGKWPDGSYNLYSDGDVWPSRPILFRKRHEAEATNGQS